MINEKELRIGNYIYMPFIDENLKVSGIALGSNGMTFIQSTISGSHNFYELPEKYNPIELTEEWLFKLGFEKSRIYLGSYIKTPLGCKRGYGFRFHTQYPFSKDKFHLFTECSYLEHQIHVSNGMKYVHQLQNLYFALTGEELKLK